MHSGAALPEPSARSQPLRNIGVCDPGVLAHALFAHTRAAPAAAIAGSRFASARSRASGVSISVSDPNPYVPLGRRVELYFDKDILRPLRASCAAAS